LNCSGEKSACFVTVVMTSLFGMETRRLTNSQLAKLTEYLVQGVTDSGLPTTLTDSQLAKVVKYAEQVAAEGGRLPNTEATTLAPEQTH
jgi:hypothetical protein